MESIGILGGTFNPPHLGHLAVAVHARDELSLDSVLLMPARIPPHKPTGADPGAEHRVAMCRALVQGEQAITVSEEETGRAGPSYTVDTLRSMHASHPGAELTFVVGADTANTLPSWREPREIVRLARLAVASRDGSERTGVLDTVASVGGEDSRVLFLEMGELAVSSSLVRELLARSEPVEELTGPAVAGYIARHGLYRQAR